MPRCPGGWMLQAFPHGDTRVPHPCAHPLAPQAARTLPEGPSLPPFVGCRCPEQVLGSRREVTAQAGSCQTGLCVAAIKSGVFVYPARGAENQGSFLGVTWPASPRRGWEPQWGLCLAPATLAVSPPPGLPAKGREGHRPTPRCWGAEAEGILASFLLWPPAQEAALSRPHPAPSRCVRPRGPPHARSSWAVATSSLPGVGVGSACGWSGAAGRARELALRGAGGCAVREDSPWGRRDACSLRTLGRLSQRPRDWASPGSFRGGLWSVSRPRGPGGVARCRRAGAGARPRQVLPAPELARLAGRQVPVLVAAPAAGGRWGWVWEGGAPPWRGAAGGSPRHTAACPVHAAQRCPARSAPRSPGELPGMWWVPPSTRSPCWSLGPAGKGGAGGGARSPGCLALLTLSLLRQCWYRAFL